MFRLNSFRSHGEGASCILLVTAAWLALPQSVLAQDAAGDPSAATQAEEPQGPPPPMDPPAEQPKTDTPAEPAAPADAPAPDAPKADTPPAETPPVETPPTEAPKTDVTPAPDAPSEAPTATPETATPETAVPATPTVPTPTAPTAQSNPEDKTQNQVEADARKQAKLPPDVSVLEPEARFALVDQLRTQDDRVTPTEYEQARKLDPDLTPDKEFADLDTDNNQSLNVDEFAAGFAKTWLLAIIVVATLVLPFLVAIWVCRAMRLPEYSTRMGFVLLAIAASAVVILLGQLRYGIDLRGGVILVYQVDKYATERLREDGMASDESYMDRLIGALNLRVNPGGQKEIVIRKFGEDEVEIIVPEAQPAEIEQLKKTIRTAGFLEFRIMANDRNLPKFLRGDTDKLLEDAQKPGSPVDVKIPVENDKNEEVMVTVARWYPVDPEQIDLARESPNRADRLIQRKNLDGQDEVLALVRDAYRDRELVVRGSELSSAGQGRDEQTGELSVDFTMTSVGAANLSELTGDFGPEDNGNFQHRMGIVFDGKLISAPGLKSVLNDRVQISGNYTKQTVGPMIQVLNAGSLPAVLIETPVSQNDIGATVGEDTIQKGRLSIIVSTALVLAFMAAFYRFSGLVACVALLLNVAITFAVIILFKAPLTLPGLAGLALGIGMAVDANVLIFERIREELDRGAALRMAIRNGFDRASTTIIDSNLTTVITGLILYWIGTDQVKGFAITLIIGIAANLFTAITFTRLVFDIADKKRMLTKLTMSRLIEGTKFDFIGKQRVCIAASLILIAIGLVATFTRGITILDIDFAGGTSVDVVFKGSKNIDTLRDELKANGVLDATVSNIKRQGQQDVQFKVDTSLGNPSSLPIVFAERDADGDGKLTLDEYIHRRKGKARSEAFAKTRFAELDANGDGALSLKEEFAISREDVLYYYIEGAFENQLRRNSLDATPPAPITATSAIELPHEMRDLPERAVTANHKKSPFRLASYQAEDGASQPEGETAAQPAVPENAAPAATPDANAGQPESPQTPAADPVTPPATTPPSTTPPSTTTPPVTTPPADPATTNPATANPGTTDPATVDPSLVPPTTTTPPATPTASTTMQSSSTMTFAEKVSYKQVQGALDLIVKEKFPGTRVRITHAESPGSQEATTKWNLETTLPPAEAKSLLDVYSAQLAAEPVFPAASSIGPNVAGKAKQQAVFAIVVSLLAIIVYVWIRFQKVSYGVAAVVALVHDVLITLGFIALSSYFAEAVPGLAAVLQIDPFKINLTVVAAFLTIIGFSINDTIVIFDRVREVRGKSPYLTADMVNVSVNQMLGRTFLTSFTVLMVVFILYFFGGETIHGFAFAMLVGLVSGVYSTIYIANPVVLWLSQKQEPKKAEVRAPAQQVAS
jgi:SecD/SecF fusion protein